VPVPIEDRTFPLSTTTAAAVPVIAGLAAIADRFDAALLDQWGVIHDGTKPYLGVIACLEAMRKAGKRIVMLSNAPRRAGLSRERLRTYGIDPALVEGVVTSGEATHRAVAEGAIPALAGARTYFHVGRFDHSDDVLLGLPLERVEDVGAADFLLVTNLRRETDELGPYEATLAAATKRGLPLLCANPDLEVVHNGRRELCAGAVAARYAELGGVPHYRGKPHPEVYGMVRALLPDVAPARMLAVGDGLGTDILGGRRAGHPTLLVTGGLLADRWGIAPQAVPDPAHLAAACAEAGTAPDWAIPTLAW